jgi:hypothetical protein
VGKREEREREREIERERDGSRRNAPHSFSSLRNGGKVSVGGGGSEVYAQGGGAGGGKCYRMHLMILNA